MLFFRQYEPPDTLKKIIREFQILHMKWDEADALPPPYIVCLANTEQNLYFYPRGSVTVLSDPGLEGIVAPTAAITGPKNKPVGLKF